MSTELGHSTVGEWLHILGDSGDHHTLYLPEAFRHLLDRTCPCMPRVDHYGVVVHATYTAHAPGRSEHEH